MPATRETICLTERSRVGESSWPRKYFWATMFVAFCDHDFGNSTFVLLERDLVAVADPRVADLPLDLLERMDARLREQPLDTQRLSHAGLRLEGCVWRRLHQKLSSPVPGPPVGLIR